MIEGIPIAGLTAPALLSIAILMLLTGRLWTNSAYAQKSKEADQWREAYEKEREARSELEYQTSELLEVTKTTQSFIMAVFNNSEKLKLLQRQSGEADEVSSQT